MGRRRAGTVWGVRLDGLVSDFIAETREGLEALDSELVRFEQSPDDPATLGGIFRLIHTIKGTCGFLGLARLQTVAHSAENVLGAFRDGVLPVTPNAVSAVLDTVDLIRTLIDALGATGSEPDGDDSVLIARLEDLLVEALPAAAAASPEAPVSAEVPRDGRPLIDRLGGDATLDAAAEMALGSLRRDADLSPMFAGADPDLLQGRLRDSLCGTARRVAQADTLAEALAALAVRPPAGAEVLAILNILSDALTELGATEADIDELRALVPIAAEAAAPPACEDLEESDIPPEPETMAISTIAEAAETPARRAPDPMAAALKAEGEGTGPAQTIRVSVDALEHLMTVVSELVLIRNQLIQALRLDPESPFAAPLNRLNQVTSELQEGVMTTRMQPISGAWAKLPRLVRDLAHDLGKVIDLQMMGQETELDRQVLELIKDPLTHMIRNAADHGLETPAERLVAGKTETGRITLQARHEGGAIVIEVADDGRGLSAEKIRAKAVASGLTTPAQAEQMSDADARQMIFLPGFSTAAAVTSISGRGVGMDVVRTNIEKIGGTIELSSVEGQGTRFTIRIPLTLTIVSALIVECCGERFAMPQSSVVELVSASDTSSRSIEHIDGAAVIRLRDRLLPLISLQAMLGLEPGPEPATETCIVVARVGTFTFGVIVDRVFDMEEIVVKPVATVLRHLKFYSGATIMGDGSVILILDFKGISIESGASQNASGMPQDAEELAAAALEVSSILVFRAADDSLKAAPLANVSRIEEVGAVQIEQVNGQSVIQYLGRLMPILGADAAPARRWEGPEKRPLLVFVRDDRAVGLLVNEIVDVVETSVVLDLSSAQPGSLGSLIIAGAATEMIDVAHYWRRALNETTPEAIRPPAAAAAAAAARTDFHQRKLLLIDPSPFAQLLLRPLLSQAGYDVTVTPDPQAALAHYDAGERFHLIMADTSNQAEARQFASAFARAAEWHATPMLSLAVTRSLAGNATPDAPPATLLDAVADAIGELRGAA